MSEYTVRGECTQLLQPEEVPRYAVGPVPELFAEYGWSVAVVESFEHDATLLDRLRRFWPTTQGPGTFPLLVYDPAFREGDTVRLSCADLDGTWFVHPEMSLAPQEVVA